MPYRNKTYVAMDFDNDGHYYRLMQAWHANDGIEFSFNNSHDLSPIRPGSSEDTIKRHLRERMANSKLFVLLVGDRTIYQQIYVRYEVELAMQKDLPIVVVNTNGSRDFQSARVPLILRDQLAIHIPFGPRIMQHTMDNWPMYHYARTYHGPKVWSDATYQELGL